MDNKLDAFRGEVDGKLASLKTELRTELLGEMEHGKIPLAELDLLDYSPGYVEGKSRLGCQVDLRGIPDKSLIVKVHHID